MPGTDAANRNPGGWQAGMPVARNVGRAFGGGFQVGEGSRGGEGEARGIQLSTSRIDGVRRRYPPTRCYAMSDTDLRYDRY
eukprot:2750937-Rhodomonas_salina.3